MKVPLKKHFVRETGAYLVFGVLTSLISLLSFCLLIMLMGEALTQLANIISFVLAVSFAYITNKLFVFQSKSFEKSVLKREITTFLSARIFSLVFEQAGLLFAQFVLHWDEKEFFSLSAIFIAKAVLTVLVVIMNYIFSKLIIFKQKL